MSTEYREHALALLRNEPTRSLPLGELRYRLSPAGTPVPALTWLEHELACDPRFRLLPPAAAVSELPAAYGSALGATGIAVETRVVLAEPAGEQEPEALSETRATLLAALARDASLHAQVSAAFGALEEVGGALGDVFRTDAAAPTTTPLRALPAPRRSRPRSRPRA